LRARGFTLLELVVVVVAIAILTGFALDRLLPLVGRAQHVAFKQVQNELQTALLLAAAERITRGESQSLPELARANPMSLLLKPPANYLGELAHPEGDGTPGHSWFYDTQNGRLVYRVGRHTRFEPLTGPPDRVELTVSFLYGDRDGDGVFRSGDDFHGLRLDSVHAYRWPD
jgi:prepilin-type N-terminal cleavage/methylation domain-containing protein